MFVSVYRFEEIVKKFKVEYHAGGATQNSIKVAQVSRVLRNSLTSCSATTSLLREISLPMLGPVSRVNQRMRAVVTFCSG